MIGITNSKVVVVVNHVDHIPPANTPKGKLFIHSSKLERLSDQSYEC